MVIVKKTIILIKWVSQIRLSLKEAEETGCHLVLATGKQGSLPIWF